MPNPITGRLDSYDAAVLSDAAYANIGSEPDRFLDGFWKEDTEILPKGG